MPAPTTTPTIPTNNAELAARDAAIFLTAGLVVGLAALGILAIWSAPEIAQGYAPEIAMFSLVGASAWCSLSVFGAYKLSRSQRAGAHNIWSKLSTGIAVFNVTAVLLFLSIEVLPGILGPHLKFATAAVVGLVPLSTFCAGFWWVARRSPHAGQANVRRASCALAVSLLLLAYLVAIVIEGFGSPEFRAGGVLDEAAEQLMSSGLKSVTGICIALAGIFSPFFYAWTLRDLYVVRRSGAAGRRAGWLLFGAWVQLGLYCIVGPFFFLDDPIVVWGVQGALASAALAMGVGVLVSRPWRPRRTWILRYVVTLPLLLLLWLFVPMCSAILIGSSFDHTFYGNELEWRHPWMWYVPESLRAPIAARLAAHSTETSRYVYWMGLAGTGELKQEALKKGDMLCFWAWQEREPEAALETALAVTPPTTAPSIPNVGYERAAGWLIARRATDAEILKRLDGKYSNQLLGGIMIYFGFAPGDGRGLKFRKPIAKLFEGTTADLLCWRMWAFYDPKSFGQRALRLLQESPPDYSTIVPAMNAARSRVPHVISKALESGDSTIRTVVLSSWPHHDCLEQVLGSAEGLTPGCTPNERRAAALSLEYILSQPITATFKVTPLNSSGGPNPGAALSAQETRDIDALCTSARKKLKR